MVVINRVKNKLSFVIFPCIDVIEELSYCYVHIFQTQIHRLFNKKGVNLLKLVT